jgi:hypothetical protein
MMPLLAARESSRVLGRLPRLGASLALCLCVVAGCTKPPPPATPPAAQPSAQAPAATPQPQAYPSLCADPAREAVLTAYLGSWRARDEAPKPFADQRSKLLAAYAEAYADLVRPGDEQEYDRRLRVAWDLCGVVHATAISPAEVKEALNWEEPVPPRELGSAEVSLEDAAQHPTRTRVEGLPSLCRKLLRAVPATGVGEGSFADYVSAHSRQVYLTAQLVEWSPAIPLDVCGSSEPLTRTLILMPASYVDLSPKPDWSLAAVAVHESAHVAWFHRREVSREPRLLLTAPNERNAFIVMAQFLEGLLQVRDPALKDYTGRHSGAIRDLLRQARENVAQANERLGLARGDLDEHLTPPTER